MASKKRVVAIGSAGNLTAISVTSVCRYFKVEETESPAQGLEWQEQKPDGTYSDLLFNAPGVPIELGNPVRKGSYGPVVGWPMQTLPPDEGGNTYIRPADAPVKVASRTGVATTVLVTETP